VDKERKQINRCPVIENRFIFVLLWFKNILMRWSTHPRAWSNIQNNYSHAEREHDNENLTSSLSLSSLCKQLWLMKSTWHRCILLKSLKTTNCNYTRVDYIQWTYRLFFFLLWKLKIDRYCLYIRFAFNLYSKYVYTNLSLFQTVLSSSRSISILTMTLEKALTFLWIERVKLSFCLYIYIYNKWSHQRTLLLFK
jgi:predicted histidine transporter YuiF (NhaC family)